MEHTKQLIESLGPPGGSALDLGMGDGRLVAWLVVQGFDCVGIDVVAPAGPLPDGASIIVGDVREVDFGVRAHDLVVARHLLQFLRPSEREPVLRRAWAALRPGGTLIVEAFTTEDPSCTSARERGLEEIEPDAFTDASGTVLAFIRPGQLALWAESVGARAQEHLEKVDDDHGPAGAHVHHSVTLVCVKVAEKPKLPWRKWMLGTSAVTCAIGPLFTFACTPSETYGCAYICDDDPSCVPRDMASDAQTEVPAAADGSPDAVQDGSDAGSE